ncbi:origin recognition complex, subunit 4 [Coemansia reversa NRRL 1564]|uniref:Origin recognition complex subunit 4 n=1 Tax=Coemansia reversa (strain ATCC 12441 / NRRL 1564) TaxID=763665 RepID=A0A2G5BF33_COERN|nr:origin recognition complex, subunit 4 [Coemansia reversa NRRL 1564]|eukprot:PIA17620.1 origin recognition complex, subunit 4 [Coemansia reversa NRRL 1564]
MLLGRLYGRTAPAEVVGQAAAVKTVAAVVRQTVENGEGNSVIVVGPRGTGKTAVVRQALAAAGGIGKHHVVRLSGFVHTNDGIALRDIARQLLAAQDVAGAAGTFAEALAYVLGVLRAADGGVAPVVFVLEEFDQLAQHPKQVLLYTLFDMAQRAQTPVCVVGVTARIDVVDLLEKRVKSRFSHRLVHVHGVESLEAFTDIARTALRIESESRYARQFRQRVDEILTTPEVAAHVAAVYEMDKDARQLLQLFAPAAGRLTVAEPLLCLEHVQRTIAHEATSGKMRVVGGISLLELCLVMAMHSLVRGGSCRYNFEMVYDEYKQFMSRHVLAATGGGAMKIYKKPVALKAMEALVALEVVRPVGAAGARAPKEYRMVQLMLEPAQVLALMADRVDVPVVIRRWAQQ